MVIIGLLDSEANFASNNPTLAAGQLAIINQGANKGLFKIGDGTSAWNALGYANSGGGGGGGGVTDHGALTGLSDDDHSQYHNDARGDARYSQLSHNHDGAYSAISHVHTGVYASYSHNHDGNYANIAHNHDTLYSELAHTHSDYIAQAVGAFDNEIPRFDSNSGNILQGSDIFVDDSGNMLVNGNINGDAITSSDLLKANAGLQVAGQQRVSVKTITEQIYTLVESDFIVNVENISMERTIHLPDAQCLSGRLFYVKDSSGSAASYNITLNPETKTIDNDSDFIIDISGGAVAIYSDGANWFTI